MGQSITGTIGAFCLILAFVTFWLPSPWWWLSILFVLISFLSVAISVTWDIAGFGQKQVEKLSDE